MRFLPPITARADDKDLDRSLRNLDDRVRQLVTIPILDGVLIEDVKVSSSFVEVIHGLGRTPKGVICVKHDGAIGALRSKNFTTKTISIASYNPNETVSLWIF